MEDRSPRAQAKADQIRRAAEKLFLAHGVGATSMDAITAEAGVSKQTIYAYYPSKDALVAAVLDELTVRRTQPWQPDRSAQEPIESWEELDRTLVDVSKRVTGELMDPEQLATVRVVVAETGLHPAYGALFRTSVAEPILKAVHAILRRAADGGVLPGPPHEDMARMLVGSLLSFVFLDGLLLPDNIKRPSSRRIRRLVTYFLGALRTSSDDRVMS